VDFNDILRRRLTITGLTLRSRSRELKNAIAAELRQKVWSLIEAKKIRPVIFRVFALAGAAGAHALMESGAHIGKIILKVAER
jgi:NADPH2:quinone reductase